MDESGRQQLEPQREPLRLAKSGLAVESGELVKRDGQNLVARHELAKIEKLELQSYTDPFAVTFMVASTGGAIATKLFIETPWLSWTLTSILGVLAVVFLIARASQRLLVVTPNGEVTYNLVDQPDHHAGFVVALKAEVDKASGFRATF